MLRYHSVGISTIVALMAAHRAVSNRRYATHTVFDQEAVTTIRRYLAGDALALDEKRALHVPDCENANDLLLGRNSALQLAVPAPDASERDEFFKARPAHRTMIVCARGNS